MSRRFSWIFSRFTSQSVTPGWKKSHQRSTLLTCFSPLFSHPFPFCFSLFMGRRCLPAKWTAIKQLLDSRNTIAIAIVMFYAIRDPSVNVAENENILSWINEIRFPRRALEKRLATRLLIAARGRGYNFSSIRERSPTIDNVNVVIIISEAVNQRGVDFAYARLGKIR